MENKTKSENQKKVLIAYYGNEPLAAIIRKMRGTLPEGIKIEEYRQLPGGKSGEEIESYKSKLLEQIASSDLIITDSYTLRDIPEKEQKRLNRQGRYANVIDAIPERNAEMERAGLCELLQDVRKLGDATVVIEDMHLFDHTSAILFPSKTLGKIVDPKFFDDDFSLGEGENDVRYDPNLDNYRLATSLFNEASQHIDDIAKESGFKDRRQLQTHEKMCKAVSQHDRINLEPQRLWLNISDIYRSGLYMFVDSFDSKADYSFVSDESFVNNTFSQIEEIVRDGKKVVLVGERHLYYEFPNLEPRDNEKEVALEIGGSRIVASEKGLSITHPLAELEDLYKQGKISLKNMPEIGYFVQMGPGVGCVRNLRAVEYNGKLIPVLGEKYIIPHKQLYPSNSGQAQDFEEGRANELYAMINRKLTEKKKR